MVITSSSSNDIEKFLEALNCDFLVKDIGRVSYFLGLELDYLPNGVLLS